MFPDRPEGQLTNLRASLVNAKMLSLVAGELGYNDYLLLSKGETKETGKARQYILANAFEAVMGAIYLDCGYHSAVRLVEDYLMPQLETVMKTGSYKDSKSRFQERAQEEEGITPLYKVLEESGPDHDKRFVVGVFLGDECISRGEGSSKQEGEIDAAKNALSAKHW
jgi:ribonuclease-3